jgi:hypothetical protein
MESPAWDVEISAGERSLMAVVEALRSFVQKLRPSDSSFGSFM